MSCKSAIYTVNNTNTPITITNDVPAQILFGSVIRRFGPGIQLDGGSIVCCGAGYFDTDILLTVTPTDAGPITAQLYQDGVAIPGAFSTLTGTAATPLVLPINALIRNCGYDCNSNLTLKIDGSCVVNNLSTVVEKI